MWVVPLTPCVFSLFSLAFVTHARKTISGGLERLIEGVMYAFLSSICLCIRQEMHA
jgi:hypothetical protein